MSKLISIGTAVPAYAHAQQDILPFMQHIYGLNETGKRKLRYLYQQGGIEKRYSVVPDYTLPAREWKFYPPTENLEPFPSLEQRMQWFDRHAAPLSLDAIRQCLGSKTSPGEITHLITVSCTGMSAPGLDLEIAALLDLPRTVFRTSVNFMGCYAAIHALKLADALCKATKKARILIVCTELCTLHFQRTPTTDNIMSSLLFADGSAAALVVDDDQPEKGLNLAGFYAEIQPKGKKDMSWQLSSTGFQMGLSSYIPNLIAADFAGLIDHALQQKGIQKDQINHWCIHPGGKKILEVAGASLHLSDQDLAPSYDILREYGNMSSATLLFVLQRIMNRTNASHQWLLAAAFGPGLTMETMLMQIAA